MKSIIVASLIFGISVFCQSVSPAQRTKFKTVKGNLRGRALGGSGYGYFGLRVGDRVIEFIEQYKYVKYFGVKKKNVQKTGAEYIIKYSTDGEGANWVDSLTFTGRVKIIAPCSVSG